MKRSILFLFVTLFAAALQFAGCSKQGQPGVSGDRIREYANALYNRELYAQAVREYQRYLDLYRMDDQERANIYYIMGNIYFERLHDYENALAAYLKVKHVFPGNLIQKETDRQIVACLERLHRSTDAKQALDEAASLDPSRVTESRPGTVIARIGDREITSGDLAHQIGQLPEYIRSQIDTPEKKREFLEQYIATELFYDAAKRQGLDRDKEVIEGAFQAKKNLMVQQYLTAEISRDMEISPEDVELYYQAHQDRYAEKGEDGRVKRQKPLGEVREQAARDLVQEKQQKAYGALVERMMRAEKVEIYDDRIP